MRVVHVHRIAGIGGSERHLLTLLPALAAQGFEAAFVGLDGGGDPEPFYAELDRAGVPYRRVTAVRRLRRALSSFSPTSCTRISCTPTSGERSPPAGRALVSTKHNDDPFRTGAFRFVERALGRRARAVICITESLARFTTDRVGIPSEKISVIHYGLDELPPAWSDDPPPELPEGARVVLSLGRLVPQKGHDVSLRAFTRIREQHPGSRARDPRGGAGARAPRGARPRARPRRLAAPPRPRRRRRRLAAPARAPPAPGALGGVRPRAAGGDAGCAARRRDARQLDPGDRRRRRDRACSSRRTIPTRSRPRSGACSPTTRSRSGWARRDSPEPAASSPSSGWRAPRPTSTPARCG